MMETRQNQMHTCTDKQQYLNDSNNASQKHANKTNGVIICDWPQCVSAVLTLESINWTAREERHKLSLTLSSEENNGH